MYWDIGVRICIELSLASNIWVVQVFIGLFASLILPFRDWKEEFYTA